ncbi:hypothetical protein Fot_38485 [Forsythia ovata]|uniref:Uncharacterized protein n=1 Tax=Forsythia ovata TaxID=205694 RepID=A0ABD1S2N9_9LAMI
MENIWSRIGWGVGGFCKRVVGEAEFNVVLVEGPEAGLDSVGGGRSAIGVKKIDEVSGKEIGPDVLGLGVETKVKPGEVSQSYVRIKWERIEEYRKIDSINIIY